MLPELLEQLPTDAAPVGPYRAEDYALLPDEPRCELIRGYLLVTPSPRFRHQAVLGALFGRFREWALQHRAVAGMAPMDVTLFSHTVVQPDLYLVSLDRRSIVRERIDGAPDVVVEILSPSTEQRDREQKLRLYLEAGVREIWIVDAERRSIEIHAVRDGGTQVIEAREGELRSRAFPDLFFDLSALWSEVDDASVT